MRRNLPDDIAVSFLGKSGPYISGDIRPNRGDDPSVLTRDDRLAEVQLLACIKAAKGSGPIGKVKCAFTDPPGVTHTFPLYEGDYKVTVREARTGRVVRTLTIPGTLNGTDNCPVTATDTGHTVLLRALDWAVVSDRLRPLASAPAPS
ncbi:hypothetical protein [Spirillospora sp. NPDC029432]|uniref:hypothetical protein n=1 Tax=Spirillospora sp. NPDC029432 TaxID=3154599 RepID=UPI003454D92E